MKPAIEITLKDFSTDYDVKRDSKLVGNLTKNSKYSNLLKFLPAADSGLLHLDGKLFSDVLTANCVITNSL
jgi:hypothetical protein